MDPLDRALAQSGGGKKGQAVEAVGLFAKAKLLRSLLVAKQLRVALDPSKRIAVRCPRRAGKTTVVRARLMYRCLTVPGSACLYIALTRPKAKELMWLGKSGLKAIVAKLGLVVGVDVEFNNSELLMTFSNGSSIQLAGASTADEIDKFRGPEYDEVWIDEAKSYPPKLFAELLEEALEPALVTRNGVLGMIGTPGNMLAGKFYEVTRPGSEESVAFDDEESARAREAKHERYWKLVAETGEVDDEDIPDLWSFHTWTIEDNTAEPFQWARALRLKKRNGWTDRNPKWLREYLGQWAADDTDAVYKFLRHDEHGKPKNIWTPGPATKGNPFGLPHKPNGWTYVYGMDLGASDPFALEIVAYSDDSADIYQVYEFVVGKKRNFTPTQIGELLTELIGKTGWPIALVSDHSHLGAAIMQDILLRFGIRIEPAPRGPNEKLDGIELVNGDLVDGRMKLLDVPGQKNHLAEEMTTLQWDESGIRENKSQANHACDAVVAARRKALHHLVTDEEDELEPGTQAAIEARIDEEERRAVESEDDDGHELGSGGARLARFMRGGRR